ncbi:HIT domain-containing protein [soil metagenome]
MTTPSRDLPAGARDPVGPAQTLAAPWRLEYLEALADSEARARRDCGASQAGAAPRPAPDETSFLGLVWENPAADIENHVIVRSAHGLILLNAYPYSNGHILVALGAARARLLDYSSLERRRLWALVDLGAQIVEAALNPQGLNIGVNQGRAAGAGVPGHLHVHVVPRWGGDVNFMTAVARVRVIPSSLESMAQRLRAAPSHFAHDWGALLAE